MNCIICDAQDEAGRLSTCIRTEVGRAMVGLLALTMHGHSVYDGLCPDHARALDCMSSQLRGGSPCTLCGEYKDSHL